MLLAGLNRIQKSFGAFPVLNDATMKISSGEKRGLIGPNGSGKTTLIRLICRDLEPDSGSVYCAPEIQIGHVRQHVESTGEETVLAYALGTALTVISAVEAAEARLGQATGEALDRAIADYQTYRERYDLIQGDSLQERARSMLDALGLNGKSDQVVSTLSGGEKNILSLARALLMAPELLILDEPDNHLDFNGVAWLEAFLNRFRGAVLIISHNRYLLDRVVDGVYHLEDGSLRYYDGGYSDYRETRLRELLAQQADYAANQKRLEQLEELVNRFEQIARVNSDPAWGKRLRAKRSQLDYEKQHAVAKPKTDAKSLRLDFSAPESRANIALQLTNYSRQIGDKLLFNQANLNVTCGERIALIGPNGCGKSTLLRDIATRGHWESDDIRIGPSLEMFYCAQEQEILHPERTILEELRLAAPLSNDAAARYMRRFQFNWDDLQKQIKILSGGERNRMQLALMMIHKPNFLILDEPTNHLDIPAREAVEEALTDLNATILVVSHDRYLLDKITTRVVEIVDGQFVSFIGSFSEFWYEKQRSNHKVDGRVQTRRKERSVVLNSKPAQSRDNHQIEEKIHEAEVEKQQLERLINDAFQANNYREGRNLTAKLTRLNLRIDELYGQWMQADKPV